MSTGKQLIALGLMLLILTAQAEPSPNHLILHGVSYHTVPRLRDPQWNESNPGLGLRHEFIRDTLSGQVGFYKNSFYKDSVYAVADWTPLHLGPVHAGVFGGFASGYVGKAGVAGGLLGRLQGDKTSLTLRYVPAKKNSIFTLELGYRF
jgi:hypothetical protein